MRIEFDFSALKRTRWYEYAVRFFFGGAVTVAAGVIAKHYGAVVGGLFLAFPAIFPASATLVQKHETERKRDAGIIDNTRGRKALACFAFALWGLLSRSNAVLSLLAGLTIWLVVALLLWRLRKIPHGK